MLRIVWLLGIGWNRLTLNTVKNHHKQTNFKPFIYNTLNVMGYYAIDLIESQRKWEETCLTFSQLWPVMALAHLQAQWWPSLSPIYTWEWLRIVDILPHDCLSCSQYHGCWWPGDARSQAINSHDIDLVLTEYFGHSITRVNGIFMHIAAHVMQVIHFFFNYVYMLDLFYTNHVRLNGVPRNSLTFEWSDHQVLRSQYCYETLMFVSLTFVPIPVDIHMKLVCVNSSALCQAGARQAALVMLIFSCDQVALRTLLPVSPSVRLLHLFHNVPVIISSALINNDRSDAHAKGKGQRSRSQRSEHNLAVSGP